jgi:DNA-directed RNA polymerase subunit M/transcription elongation factor TFIIS
MFCKTCGTLLLPKKTEYGKWMACPNGHSQPELNQERNILAQTNSKQAKNIEVMDGTNILAVHDHKCKKCANDKAELIEISCSYSDEDNMYRMKCGKCGFVEQLEGKIK